MCVRESISLTLWLICAFIPPQTSRGKKSSGSVVWNAPRWICGELLLACCMSSMLCVCGYACICAYDDVAVRPDVTFLCGFENALKKICACVCWGACVCVCCGAYVCVCRSAYACVCWGACVCVCWGAITDGIAATSQEPYPLYLYVLPESCILITLYVFPESCILITLVAGGAIAKHQTGRHQRLLHRYPRVCAIALFG
jgi:hypothetical protein